MDDKQKACDHYFKILDCLNQLRLAQASPETIEAAKRDEAKAWAEVERLIPEAYCR